jgi:iron complex outermembrane receptor protein
MHPFQKTAIAVAAALLASGATQAQNAPADASVVVVTGQRAALNSAQKMKQNSDEIVDSIVAEDIGKLPDRSVTEVLQRIVGVTIDRTMSKGDPEHYSVEGSGVTIRGLSYVRSELNGRDSFSANGGRSLNFEDVPPELMSGVDIYKNPSAEQIEGAVGGLVNLRTAMPFDFKGRKLSATLQDTYSELKKGKPQPSGSFLFSDRWKTGFGEVGALIDLAYSKSGTRTDAFQVEPYYPRGDVDPGRTVWIPKGAQWRTLEFERKREGAYAAFQWKKDATLNSSLTFFKSRYQMQWDEQAIFSSASPYNIQVAPGAAYDARGALQAGVLSDPQDKGIDFGADTRSANRKSDTTDIAWHLTWRPTSAWQFDTDLQRIRATSRSFDSTVATAIKMPRQTIDLRGDVPTLSFGGDERAYLANPANYYWAFTQEHLDRSHAGEWAWRADAKYSFDDPVLRDLRVGVRFTDRDSVNENSNPSYHWAAITQPWQGEISGLAYLGDPRFANQTQVHDFGNFFNNGTNVPALVFPNVALATGYPGTYATLHGYTNQLCKPDSTCATWAPATFGSDPAGVNEQKERTSAVYGQLRFGFDDLKYPVDGNVGLRYVRTKMTASGYTVFNPNITPPPAGSTVVGPAVPAFAAFSQGRDYANTYHNALPSLNLRMKASEKLQFRFGAAMGISRPDFSQLQGYTTLSQNVDATFNQATNTQTVNAVSLTGEGQGNPNLRPVQSRQVDLTAEWYFAPAGSLTVAVFNKRLKDVIINQSYTYNVADVAGNPHGFTVTGPVNGARGHARGIEVAYQQYFDKLPGWLSGFGLQANYTWVDSKQKLYNPVYSAYCSGSNGGAGNLNLGLNGCDVNGTTFGDLPLQGLSRQSYNLALMYDKGPLSARLAWNWRSKSLQGVNVHGTNGTDGTDSNPASATFGQHNVAWGLPTWADSYGQLDASVFYNLSENLSIGLEAQNLTDAKFRQLMQQNIGMKGRAWFVSGPRYTAQLRYSF